MSNKKVLCPLSKSADVELIERIPVSELDRLYRHLYQAPISRLYPNVSTIDIYKSLESDLIWFEPLIPGDEEFYNTLQKRPWYYVDFKREFEVAASFIGREDSVLEVGSGKGNFAKYIKTKKYIGLDFSQMAKEMAKSNGITVINESVQSHAEKNLNQYDVACAFQVLEHVPDVYEFLKGMVDSLKPGGKLIIAVPSEESYISKSNNLALNLPPHHMSRYTDASLKSIPRYLNVDLIHLEHDPLQPQHHFDFTYQLALNALKSRFGIRYKSVDNSLLNKILRIPALVIGKLLKAGVFEKNCPIGHTVIAVYQKRTDVI